MVAEPLQLEGDTDVSVAEADVMAAEPLQIDEGSDVSEAEY